MKNSINGTKILERGKKMKYKLSKKLILQVMKEEIKKTEIAVEILPITKLENLFLVIKESKQKNEKLSPLKRLKTIQTSVKETRDSLGDTSFEKNNIKIFLEEIKKDSQNEKIYLLELLTTTYHEYNHKTTWEQATDIPNLRNFILLIEQLIIETTELYNFHHDDFYEEIIANAYAIEKTEQYLQRYPNIFEKLKGYLENDKLNYQIDLINYDIEQFINYFSKTIQSANDKSQFFKEEYPYRIVECLYTKEGRFKTIVSLRDNKDWNALEKEVQYSIVASKSYLQSQKLENLSPEELTFLKEALDYSYQKEVSRSIQNQELRIKVQEFNRKIKPNLDYAVELLSILNQKEKRCLLKIKYLKIQQAKIEEQLKQKKILNTILTLKKEKSTKVF